MGDFDTVLERLLVDGSFRAALAADPAAALAGYRLSADEIDLLRSQVSADAGGQHAVETRTSKSSLFGLLGSASGLAHGAAPGTAPQPPGIAGETFGASSHVSAAPGMFGQAAENALNAAAHGALSTGAHETLGAAPQAAFDPLGGGHFAPPVNEALGTAPAGQGTLLPGEPMPLPGDHTPVGYHPHIDADGDGKWDQYTAVQHADGSVDIYVDRNHDGRIDFIGHDRNHDGRVESADYDENFNGTFETHMRDINGDGWLDTREVRGS